MWAIDSSLDLELGVLESMNVRLSLPFKSTDVSAQFLDEHGDPLSDYNSIHHRNEIVMGIGDPTLVIDYAAVQRDTATGFNWTISAGVSIPLGQTEPNPFKLGKDGEVHQHLMYGTGTFNPMLGTRLRYTGVGYSLLTWLNGQVPLYRNKHGMKASAVYSGGLGVFSPLGLKSVGFLLQAEFGYLLEETWDDGLASPNSGRTDLITTVGVQWMINPSLSVHALVKVPFTLQEKGGQMEVPLLVLVGIDKTFRLY